MEKTVIENLAELVCSDRIDYDLPEFSNCIIAYIDLMGIKQRIKSQYTLTTLWMLIKNIDTICKENKMLYYKAFSDNIVICEKIDDDKPNKAIYDVIKLVKEIELFMFHLKFPFVRGAIVAGAIYYDNDYVLGEALLKSYEIEQNYASFPRVIVDSSVIDLVKPRKIDYVIKDRDGLYFYDYMGAKIEDIGNNSLRAIRILKHNIIWNLEINCDNAKIVSKMEWLVNYFNESCEKYNISCRITKKELNNVGIRCEPLRLIACKNNKI